MIKDHLPEYWTNPDISEYVVQVTAMDGSNLTLAEPFPFFIEGGGQPDDRVVAIVPGFSKPLPVAKILSSHSFSLQIPKKKALDLSVPSSLKLVLDIDFRHAVMRAHTCQHLLSALILNDYNINTLKAVMTDDQGSLTLDQTLSADNIEVISQRMLSFIVTFPVPVTSHVLEAGSSVDQAGNSVDLSKIRGSIPPESPYIRVLAIGDGVDLNTCGGTHISSTDQILSFFITSTKKSEITFICGFKALSFLSSLNRDLLSSSSLSNQPFDKTLSFLSTQFSSLQKLAFDSTTFGTNTLRTLFDTIYHEAINLHSSSEPVNLSSSDLKDGLEYIVWSQGEILFFAFNCFADKKLVSEAAKIFTQFSNPCVTLAFANQNSLVISVNQPDAISLTARALTEKVKEQFPATKGGGNNFLAQVLLPVLDNPFGTICEYIKTIFQ